MVRGIVFTDYLLIPNFSELKISFVIMKYNENLMYGSREPPFHFHDLLHSFKKRNNKHNLSKDT